jgi:desulfoferrodoxin (superoxide reductase-like protein)
MTDEKTDLFAQVNRPKDPANMADLEKKHLPVLTAPEKVKAGECFDVTVEVGKLLAHPNEPGHHIEFVDLYEDKVFLCRADLSAVRSVRQSRSAFVCRRAASSGLSTAAICTASGKRRKILLSNSREWPPELLEASLSIAQGDG